MPTPTRRGTQTGEFGDEWTNWWVFPATVSDEQAVAATTAQAFNHGAGRAFSHGPSIRRSPGHVLVKECCGLDI